MYKNGFGINNLRCAIKPNQNFGLPNLVCSSKLLETQGKFLDPFNYCTVQLHLSHQKCFCLHRQRYDSIRTHKMLVYGLDYVVRSSAVLSNQTQREAMCYMSTHQLPQYYQTLHNMLAHKILVSEESTFHDLKCIGHVIYILQILQNFWLTFKLRILVYWSKSMFFYSVFEQWVCV